MTDNTQNTTEASKSAVQRRVSSGPPMCHFTPMEYAWADDWPNGQVGFWECLHCGHTKEETRTYSDC